MYQIISQKYYVTLTVIIFFCFSTAMAQIFVATDGNDSVNIGTIDSPYKTLTKALSVITIGDTIYIRGGIYSSSTTISISKSGKTDSLYCLFAYADELPVFDFIAQTSSDGIKVNGWYWHIKGIESRNAYHNGIAVNGSHNIIDKCVVHDNRNTGLQLGNGASYNQIINCDSYNNADSLTGYGNADGFSPKLDVGSNNYFYGCRSWQNSDDGYDGYLRPSNNVTTTYENCWAFMNGYLKNGTVSGGNGNGFKMGGSDSKTLMHNAILINCLAFDNLVKGFDQNNNRGSMTLYNCTGFRNSRNFSLPGPIYTDSGKAITLVNCLDYAGVNSNSIMSTATQLTNSWQGFTVTSTDFINIDTSWTRGPRKIDGSLPDLTFLHLEAGSSLIDAGTNVGLPYSGLAPDLGAFESNGTSGIANGKNTPLQFFLYQNFPNPFNPTTEIRYDLHDYSDVTISIHDLLGRELLKIECGNKEAGNHFVIFDGSNFPSGIYFCRLNVTSVSNPSNSFTQSKRMILLK
jgi:hypothetical protein